MGHLINLGSGQRPFPKPWCNVDKQAKWNPDVLWDAGNPLDPCPFEAGSADIIVLHHVLEHFGCNEGNSLLQECYRLLVPNGSLLVFVPNLRALADMWNEGRLDDQVYLTNIYGAFNGSEADRHKWGFTYDSLSRLLCTIGFRWVHRFNWRYIDKADLAKDRWILAVEGIK